MPVPADPDPIQILVVDDAESVREPLSQFLRLQGFRPHLAADANEARAILKQTTIHLVLLDIMLPGEDGLSLCRHLVREARIPVILLTARVEERDRITGIELGADDYVTKPFSLRELVGRIRGILRRVAPVQAAPEPVRYWFGDLLFDVAANRVILKNGAEIRLTTGEGRLLETLVSHPNEAMSRADLLEIVRARELKPNDRTVDNLVSRLRRKLDDNSVRPGLIVTEWGGGYRIGVPIRDAR